MSDVQTVDADSGCGRCCTAERLRSIFIAVILGQVLSLCLCGTGITSQFLSEKFLVNTPTTQSFANYFLLCSVYGTTLACRNSDHGLIAVFRTRGWKYFLIALVDVEANYLLVLAYQYTNLTSIQILDCFTIPVVLLLSWCCLSTRYLLSHVVGVSVCLIGIGCLVWADAYLGKSTAGGSNKLLGDVLCLGGAALYGVCNVSEEFLVKHFDRIEFLGMIGLLGSFISGIQLAVLERKQLAVVKWSDYRVLLLYAAFATCLFAFYSLVAVVMKRSGATLFNLSILTADFYTLIAGIFLFKYKFHLLYFASYFLVLFGSVIYCLRPTSTTEQSPLSHTVCCSCCPGNESTEIQRSADENETLSHYRSFNTDPELNVVRTTEVGQRTPAQRVKYCPVHGAVVIPDSADTERMIKTEADKTDATVS